MTTVTIPNDVAEALGQLQEEERLHAIKLGLAQLLTQRRTKLFRKLTMFTKRFGDFTEFEGKLTERAKKRGDLPIERDYFEWLNTLTALREVDTALKKLRAKRPALLDQASHPTPGFHEAYAELRRERKREEARTRQRHRV